MEQKVPGTVRFVKFISNDGRNNAGTSLYLDYVTGRYYVKKKVPARRLASGGFAREVQVAESIRGHSNINYLQWVGFGGEEQLDYGGRPMGVMWMDYCDLGPLSGFQDRASHYRQILPQAFLLKCMRDMAEALCWLHHGITWKPGAYHQMHGWNPVTHNDLHEANIFLTSASSDPYYPKAVLGDFGNATSRRHAQYARQNYQAAARDDLMLYHRPHHDVEMLGTCFMYLAGDHAIVKRRFSLEALERMADRGLSREFAHVMRHIFVSWKGLPSALELCDIIHRKQWEYLSRYGIQPLAPYLFPRGQGQGAHQPVGNDFRRAPPRGGGFGGDGFGSQRRPTGGTAFHQTQFPRQPKPTARSRLSSPEDLRRPRTNTGRDAEFTTGKRRSRTRTRTESVIAPRARKRESPRPRRSHSSTRASRTREQPPRAKRARVDTKPPAAYKFRDARPRADSEQSRRSGGWRWW